MYQYKRPMRPSKPKTPKLLYIGLAVVLLVSAGVVANYIYSDFVFRHGGANPYYVPIPAEAYIPAWTPAPAPEPTPEPGVLDWTPEPELEPEYTPDPSPTPVPRVMRPEFFDYRAHYGNDEIIGRLWIPNTSINYVIPQPAYDNFFYKDHDIRQRRSIAGWVWLSAYNNLHGQDQNLVVFGHNMQRNEKFHAVRHFLREDFFFENRYIFLSTIYADYVFEVFSVYIAHINFPYIHPNFCYFEGGWEHWINLFSLRSLFDAGISVSADDRIITLSTCENARDDYRIAVHARLISETFPHLDGLDADDDSGQF